MVKIKNIIKNNNWILDIDEDYLPAPMNNARSPLTAISDNSSIESNKYLCKNNLYLYGVNRARSFCAATYTSFSYKINATSTCNFSHFSFKIFNKLRITKPVALKRPPEPVPIKGNANKCFARPNNGFVTYPTSLYQIHIN